MTDPVRPLVVIAGVQALAVLGLFISVSVAVATGAAEGLTGASPSLAAAEVIIWLLFVVGLGAIWWGLYRRRRLARTPFLLVQAFVLVVVPLFVGSDIPAWRIAGWVLAAVAVAGIVLGLRPSVRRELA
jgi:cell division protein FtsW (lipid II flippase)